VVNEPTELPEGEVVELVPLDEVLANGGDYLDDEERARLHEAIEKGLADVKAGRTVEASPRRETLPVAPVSGTTFPVSGTAFPRKITAFGARSAGARTQRAPRRRGPSGRRVHGLAASSRSPR
jgi:hypothetical protein